MQSLLCHASVLAVVSLIPRPDVTVYFEILHPHSIYPTERETWIVREMGGVDL